MTYYIMYAETNVEEWVRPSDELLEELGEVCSTSEFQFVDRTPLTCSISDEGGIEFPDFLLYDDIPLISARFRNILNEMGVDNLFYKPITLSDELLGKSELYYLALPPRIRCLDEAKSRIITENNPYIVEYEAMREADKIVILPSRTGNYKIFKLSDVTNQDIIVTKEVKIGIEKNKLVNVFFYELED